MPLRSKPSASRAALFSAWALPALACSVHDPLTLVWICACTLPLIALVGRWYKLALAASFLSLPLTAWWIGYASMNGIGPSPEMLGAVAGTTVGEALAAVKEAVRGAAGWIFACHVVLLVLSAKACSGTRGYGAERLRGLASLSAVPLVVSILAGALLPSSVFSMSDMQMRASPLGSHISVAKAYLLGGLTPRAAAPRKPPPVKERAPDTVAVMIIGESQRLSAFGPERAVRSRWDAMLQKRVEEGRGAWAPPVCASADNTQESLPLLVSATPPERRVEALERPTFLMRVKAVGYKTAWFANNDIGGEITGELGAGLWDGADSVWTESKGRLRSWNHDEILIPLLDSFVKAQSTGSRAAVLHFQGAHFPYAARYPAALFGERREGDPTLSARPVRAEENGEPAYDRANAYTARNLEEAARTLDRESRPAFLIFVPDHGENLPSDKNGLKLHMSPRSSKAAIMVPALILWNEAFAKTGRSHDIERVLSAKNIAHTDVVESWLRLAGASDVVEPTKDPKVWGSVRFGDEKSAVSCADLAP